MQKEYVFEMHMQSHFFRRTMFLSAQRMSMRFAGARTAATASLTTLRTYYTRVNGSLWKRDFIVDPRTELTAADVWPDCVQTNAITTKAAREFLVNCTKVKADHCLYHDGEVLKVFDKYHPKMNLCFWYMNNLAKFIVRKDALPANGGFHIRLCGGESQILRMCAVLSSIILKNVIGIYFDPPTFAIGDERNYDRGYELVPVKYVMWALERRLHMHTTGVALLPHPSKVAHVLENGIYDMDKVLAAMQMNNLGVVMCVNHKPSSTSGLTFSDETESQLRILRQSFHALVIYNSK
jgi:hypothetical protein